MALKTATVVVPTWGERDAGRTFKLAEMPAVQAEKWGWRMLLALKGTAGYLPEDTDQLGILGVAVRGINAFLASPVRFDELEPLLDEMMTCVSIVRDQRFPEVATPLAPGDIEEVKTIGWLRSEVLRLHTNFSVADGLSKLIETINSPLASPST